MSVSVFLFVGWKSVAFNDLNHKTHDSLVVHIHGRKHTKPLEYTYNDVLVAKVINYTFSILLKYYLSDLSDWQKVF